jgi:hypothetical protein
MRRELAAAVTLAGDDELRDPLDQGMGRVKYGRTGNQKGARVHELRR